MPREKFVPAHVYITADQAKAMHELRLIRFELPSHHDFLGSNRDYSEPDARHLSTDHDDPDLGVYKQKTESPHGL